MRLLTVVLLFVALSASYNAVRAKDIPTDAPVVYEQTFDPQSVGCKNPKPDIKKIALYKMGDGTFLFHIAFTCEKEGK